MRLVRNSRRVTEEQFQAACDVAAAVFAGQLTTAQGVQRLDEEHGVNPTSAGDFIYDYRCLVEGRGFPRGMSAAAMHHFLAQIHMQHGDVGLSRALGALEQHIQYFASRGKRLKSQQAVHDAFLACLASRN
ncbi:hypothetical protein JI739_18740 [Ramlibacter sp. AW1]|uniref:Uncharacterized protein n=1 Tax=Ramlibacter aurantiacus TaxID=2801330 RepID=A0A937D7V1_9BURK|nr:hypothetical protein [Ramlibacter aurantiacus]MBL0422393.1 hypothetical protein [Ramlibacter aurantiacus]